LCLNASVGRRLRKNKGHGNKFGLDAQLEKWLGFFGKIETGNRFDVPIFSMGLSGVKKVPKKTVRHRDVTGTKPTRTNTSDTCTLW
jgi:hypothetical protein